MSTGNHSASEENANCGAKRRGLLDGGFDIEPAPIGDVILPEDGSADESPDGCIVDLSPIPRLKDLIVDWLLRSMEKLLPPRKPS